MEDARPPPSEKSRNFSLVTYATEDCIIDVLDKKTEVINHFAYAFHDCDKYEDGTPKEPHYHVLIKTHNALFVDTVIFWFDSCVDSKGEKCNTLGEVALNFGYCFRYLWHGNKADKDKFQYSFSRVYCDDVQYFKKYHIENQQYDDKLLHAVHDLLNGETFTACVYKYGRDFIIHEKQIMDCVYRMKNEIGTGQVRF